MALGNMNINGGDYIPMELQSISTPPSESEEVVMKSASDYVRRPLSALWSWIKSKIASEVIPDVVTIKTSEITITTDWQDTGISKSDIDAGTYAVQFCADKSPIIGIWGDCFSGIMTWYSGYTNSENYDEITLHSAGHARNGQTFYLRTLRHYNDDSSGNRLTLQIKGSMNSNTASTFTFKFRRLI